MKIMSACTQLQISFVRRFSLGDFSKAWSSMLEIVNCKLLVRIVVYLEHKISLLIIIHYSILLCWHWPKLITRQNLNTLTFWGDRFPTLDHQTRLPALQNGQYWNRKWFCKRIIFFYFNLRGFFDGGSHKYSGNF